MSDKKFISVTITGQMGDSEPLPKVGKVLAIAVEELALKNVHTSVTYTMSEDETEEQE